MNNSARDLVVDAGGVQWISLQRAARLVRTSARKPVHLNSVRRWIAQGRVRGKRTRRDGKQYLLVALVDVLAEGVLHRKGKGQ